MKRSVRRSAWFVLPLLATLVLAQPTAQAETSTWINAVSGNWSDGSKWDIAPTAGVNTIIQFTQAGTYTVTNDRTNNPFVLNKIICTNSSGTISFTGNNISFQGANAGVWVTSTSVTSTFSSIGIALATNITTSGNITYTGSGSQLITGAGSITHVTNALTLSGANSTFTGGIIVTNTAKLWGISGYGSVTIHSGAIFYTGGATNTIIFNGGMSWPTSQGFTFSGPVIFNDVPNSTLMGDNFPQSITGIASGNGGFNITGSQNLTVNNPANTFKGPILLAGITFTAGSINSVVGGTASSTLGTPNTVSNGTIWIQSGMSLYLTTTNETSDRVLNFYGTTGTRTISVSGSGLLKLTSDFAVPGQSGQNCSKTLTLAGNAPGSGEVAGRIPDAALGASGQTNTSILKSGTGTWILSGANTYSGSTTITQGVLTISGSIASTNIIVTGGVLSLASRTCLDSNSVVRLSTGGTNNISYSKTIYISAIYTDNVLLAKGIYNTTTLPAFFTGPGSLSTLPPPGAGTVLKIR